MQEATLPANFGSRDFATRHLPPLVIAITRSDGVVDQYEMPDPREHAIRSILANDPGAKLAVPTSNGVAKIDARDSLEIVEV